MIKSILFLAFLALASAQFSQNFTQVLLGWGNQSVLVVPSNITDADGTTYFDLQRGTIDEPEGQWTLNLIGADGSVSEFKNVNNDLVLLSPNASQISLAGQLPPLLGITGSQLLAAVSSGVENAVTSTYGNPSLQRITTAQAQADANGVVNSVISQSSLPAFFLTPFRAQAYKEISDSLINAQKVSAAINATLEAQNPPANNSSGSNNTNSTNSTSPNVTSVSIPLNLSSFDLDNLDNVSQIAVSYGDEGVVVRLESETEAASEDDVAWDVSLETVLGNDENSTEWHLTWVDNLNNSWSVLDENGKIIVVDADGEAQGDWSTEAGWWADAENGDVGAAVGNAIEDFVDAVVANAEKSKNVVINVGDEGLNWSYPATVTGASTDEAEAAL